MRSIPFLAATVLAAIGAAQPAVAQAFQGLSTPDDGSVLYFSSPDRITGSGQSFHSKIFRWDASDGFQLVADVPDTGTSDGCTTTDFYQLSSPQISGNGTTLAYTASRPATGGRYCPFGESNDGIVQQNGKTRTFPGSISLSPHGRYAISTPTDALTNNYHLVTDLLSGPSSIVSGAFNGDRRRITDEGAVLTTEPSALVLTDRSGGTRVWQTKMPLSDAIVDRAGRTLVYLTPIGPTNPGAISTIDVSTGMETRLFTGFSPGNLYLTAEGSQLLFTNASTSGTQLYLIGVDGAGQRQIGTETVANAILSGDGTAIYANSTDARLLRIDVASGMATELAPATPLISAAYRPYPPATTIAAVGSVLTLYGSGVTSIKQVTFCGRPVSLLKGTFLQFQVPWDLPDQTCQAIVQTASPFETAITLTVQQYDPQFIGDGSGNALLFHGANWSVIGSTSPAHPGEIIIAYMTGLGPVDQNGLPTKPGFSCRFDSTPANLPYVGLAPGFPGVYQLNIQVPDVPESSAALTCGWGPLTDAYAGVWLGPN